MPKSLFRYIWEHSRRDQLIIFAVVILSLPFYYVSLDLPRKIVNEAIQGRSFESGQMTATFLNVTVQWPKWLGGNATEVFGGFEVGRLELLFGLSFLFLIFVLINGFSKYWINVAKGALGERMMRRLRFELFASSLRFTPDALRNVRSAEAATIIKDEVEPIGGFIGDAFIQPLLLGTQAVTALLFILLQSVWLGVLAGGVVAIQFVVIPRMRRELLRLGRRRQIASRRLAGRIGEVIDGMEAVQVHGTGRWERADIGNRLFELFDIRFRIYKRKFIVKFLNNILAQMTPFFFYAVGGYFAIRGRLDIGQLVAVISAYRELPPPLKELIDWDQQRLDVQVKYDQVVGYFAPEKLIAEQDPEPEDAGEPLAGELHIENLQILDAHGRPLVAGGEATIALPARIALVADGSSVASTLARILGRRSETFSGEITIGKRRLADLPPATVARRISYAGPDPILFPGSIRDNVLYGLRQRQIGAVPEDVEERRRLMEAKRTGNPADAIAADWIDLERAGAAGLEELDVALIDLLKKVGLGDDLYRFGLNGEIDPVRHPALSESIVEARERFRLLLAERGMSELVEPFDPDSYNTQATIGENLLFGVPTSRDLLGRALVEQPDFRAVLDRAKLTDDLVGMGLSIAETMTEIFAGLPSGHTLFEQFSFVHAEELAEFAAIVKRSGIRGRGGLTRDDRLRLLGLPLNYIEPRHRLGLLDDGLRERLLEARHALRAMLEKRSDPGVDFYEPHTLTAAAPVRDNLLFGRVNDTIAKARDRVRDVGAEVVREMDLTAEIESVGLDHQVGPAGRLLTAVQRSSINLVRCIVKRPDILVIDGALGSFGEKAVAGVLDIVLEATSDHTLVAVLPNDRLAGRFDAVVRFTSGQVDVEQVNVGQDGSPDHRRPGNENTRAGDLDGAGDGLDHAPDRPPRAAAE